MTRRYLLLVLVTLFICGCSPAPKNDIPHISPQCLASQSECVVSTAIGDFEILFNKEKLLTETPFTIYVNYRGDKKVSMLTGYLEGKEMYMGKVPVFFKLATNEKYPEGRFQAETLLGSCSEDTMVWTFWITATITNQASQESENQSFFIEFSSSRF